MPVHRPLPPELLLTLGLAASLVAAMAAPLAGPARAATVHYVATTGSDSASGTLSAPWRTVKRGLVALYPGDTLLVRGGTYAERIQSPTIRAGSATARITVKAYPGERPVVSGLVWMKGASYWTFDGINVTWGASNLASEHMVKFTNGVGWTFTHGEVWGAHSYAAILVTGNVAGQPAQWQITNSCIHDTYASNSTNQDHNIYVNTGTTAGSGLIERNLIFNAVNGRNVKLGPGGSTGGSVNVTIRYNTLYNSAQPISPSYDSNHNVFERNILDKAGGTYPLIYAYQLRGTDNVARSNLGYAGRAMLGSSGGVSVVNGGGNVFGVDPKFDSVSCSGFHPATATAVPFGRYAP
jgi:hypothetical protein